LAVFDVIEKAAGAVDITVFGFDGTRLRMRFSSPPRIRGHVSVSPWRSATGHFADAAERVRSRNL
jgi:hypothetical protein